MKGNKATTQYKKKNQKEKEGFPIKDRKKVKRGEQWWFGEEVVGEKTKDKREYQKLRGAQSKKWSALNNYPKCDKSLPI